MTLSVHEVAALVMQWRPLVVREARRRARSGRVDVEDLVQAGQLGVFLAAQRFDPSAGFHFGPWAKRAARWAMARLLARSAAVHVPPRLSARIFRARRELGAAGDVAAIASRAGTTPATVAAALFRARSLDAPLGSDEGAATLQDVLVDNRADDATEAFADADEHARLRAYVEELPALERDIVSARWLAREPRTLAQVAEAAGVHPSTVQSHERSALARLSVRLQTSARSSR